MKKSIQWQHFVLKKIKKRTETGIDECYQLRDL